MMIETKIGIIPKEWKCVKLRDVITEKIIKNKKEIVKDVLSVTNSQGFVLQQEYFEGTVHSLNIENYKIVEKNDFAYNPSRINVGSIDILTKYEKGALSPMYVVFSTNVGELLPEYFKYYFSTHNFFENVKRGTQGSVRDSLSFKTLSEFYYALPPINEQERIINLLSSIDEIIFKLENQINEIKKQKKGIMKYFFEKVVSPKSGIALREVCDFFSGGTPKSNKSDYYNGDIPFIRSAEIDKNKTELKLTELGLKNSATKIVNKGDLLYALYGANSGNVSISKIDGAINQAVLCIRSKEININYLRYLLEFDKERIIKKYLQGGQGNLSGEIIKSLNYNFQNNENQVEIANLLKAIDVKIEMLITKKQEYKNLKQGLMQKLLTGKIRVE